MSYFQCVLHSIFADVAGAIFGDALACRTLQYLVLLCNTFLALYVRFHKLYFA